jgi:hypothetical protein
VPGAAPVAIGVTLARDINADLSLLKVGVNYRF